MTTKASTWLSPKQCAERLGLTVRQVSNLADEGLPARVGPNGYRQYLWPDAREWYHRSKIDAAVANALSRLGPNTDSPEAAKARLANAQADMVEFDLAKKRGEYVSLAFHFRELELLAGRLAEATNSLGVENREASLELTPATVDAFWAELEDRLRSRFFDAVSDYNADDSDPADEPPAQAA